MKKFYLLSLTFFILLLAIPLESAQAAELQISNVWMLDGTAGQSYGYYFGVTGGTAPYTWSLVSPFPSFVSAESMNAQTGLFWPRAALVAGDHQSTVKVTDAAGASVQKTFSWAINSPGIMITTPDPLPSGRVGSKYAQQFAATGGTEAYTWSVMTQTFPAYPCCALELQPDGRFVAATPLTQIGTYQLGVRVTDRTGVFSQKMFNYKVYPRVSQPDDALVKSADSPTVYLVEEGMFRPFSSAAAFVARGYQWSAISVITADEVIARNIGAPLMLPDGSVIKGSSPTVYVITGGKKFAIPSLAEFYRRGLSFKKLIIVDDSELQQYPDGE